MVITWDNFDDTAVHPLEKQLMVMYPWCKGYAIEVQSKDGIIREKSFANCPHLVSVQLLDSIHTIEVGAFSGCKNLRTITLPQNLRNIQPADDTEKDVFEGCDGVHTVIIYAHHLDSGLNFTELQNIRYVLVLSGDNRTDSTNVPLANRYVKREELLQYTTTSLKEQLENTRCGVLQINVINDE